MAQIYVSDETRKLIDKVSTQDSRTQDGEIKHLFKERLREMGESDRFPDVIPPAKEGV